MTWRCIELIAESRIREAQEKGAFDDLPGAGRPLVLEDMSNVPPELRMAWKLLKNAGCLPPELQKRKEMSCLLDLLENCPEEQQQEKCAQKLRLMLASTCPGKQRHMALEAHDEYYQRVLARLARHEQRKRAPASNAQQGALQTKTETP